MSQPNSLIDQFYAEWTARGAALDAETKRADVLAVQLAEALARTPKPIPPRKPFEIDRLFTPSTLSPDRHQRYIQTWSAIYSPRPSPNPRVIAASGAADSVGFAVKDYVVAVASALDATGDCGFLREIVSVMGVLRERMAAFVLTLTLGKDKAFVASLFAFTASLCHVNRAHDPVFAEAADYWLSQYRAIFGESVPTDDLMHSYAASVETAWCLWLLTGEERYQVDAETKRIELFKSILVAEDGCATWHHRPFFARGKQEDTPNPRTTYASYIVQTMVMLNRTGLDTVPLGRLAKTVLRIIRANGTISYALDGTGDEAQSKIATRNWALLVPYDPSGELAKRLATAATANQIYIPAGLLGTG